MEIGKTSATGSFHLFVGKALSTVILAVGTIILGGLIREGDYGLYVVALIPSATFLLFQDWGLNIAITRQSAQCRSANRQADLRKTIVAGLTFVVATAAILTLVSVASANFMAFKVFNKPESAYLIAFASISIFSTALFSMAQCVFIGFERMKLVSFTLILQAIAQSATAPFLVSIGYGAFGALAGSTFASVSGSIIALVLLYFAIFRKLEKVSIRRNDIIEVLKPLLKYGVPLAIGSLLFGILTQFYSFMMALYVKDLTLIGNYRVAANFAVLPTFFTVPITAVLIPAFSKLDSQKELQLVKSVFTSSVKYASLVLVPVTMMLIVLAKNIIGTLYGSKWSFAPPFLALAVLGNLFAIFGNISLTGLFSALGETRLILKMNLLALAVGVPLAFALIPSFGINGMIIGSLVAVVPGIFISLYLARKKYGTKIDFNASARILLASTISAITTYLFLDVFAASNWLSLLLGSILFLVIYLVCAPLIGAINQMDINNLRGFFSTLGLVSKILEIPLRFMEQLLKMRISRKEHIRIL
jgi:O-antigen/teichoic acid export membrane protein